MKPKVIESIRETVEEKGDNLVSIKLTKQETHDLLRELDELEGIIQELEHMLQETFNDINKYQTSSLDVYHDIKLARDKYMEMAKDYFYRKMKGEITKRDKGDKSK